MAVLPIQELKNHITDRIHDNHEKAIDGEEVQEILHDIVDSLTAYTEDNQAADKNYIHEQGVPSASWVISHNMNKKPSVMVFDSAGTEVVGSVKYLDDNTIRISFSAAFSGKATLN